ncbi:putative reverse transcriptase domain-containing protein [Tanacetum coccineum]
MTRSSTNKLFTPYKEPEREFRSSRRHFKTLSLDESRSPNFNLFSDQEDSEEEEAETMAETMEQYMSKTRTNYGSGTNTFSGSDHEDANEHIEKVLEIVDLFHILNITIDQVMPIAFPMSLTGATSYCLRNGPNGSITTWEGLKTKFLNKYCPPARTAKKMEEINNFQQEPDKNLYQACERFKELLMKYPQHYLTEILEEIRASTEDAIQNQRASIKTLEIQIGQMRKYYEEKKGSYGSQFSEAHSEASQPKPQKEKNLGSFTLPCFINNVYFDNALVDLGASVSVMPLLTYFNLGLGELVHTKLTVELADRTVKYPKGIAENVLVGIGKFVFPVDFIILDMLEDIKVPLIFGRPFLSTAHAKIDVYKRKITLRVMEERIVFTSVKPTCSLIKRVYMLSLRERMELDLEARLIGETLVLNRSLDPFLEDYIELNDLNEPLELRRNQGDNLMPTIKEGEVIVEFRTRDDELDTEIDDYPSYCDYDKKIHIDCAHNLKFSCMIGFEFTHANFFPLLYVTNVPIFVGTVSVVTDFAILENMEDYRDEGMGDDLGIKEILTNISGEFTNLEDLEVLES